VAYSLLTKIFYLFIILNILYDFPMSQAMLIKIHKETRSVLCVSNRWTNQSSKMAYHKMQPI